MIFTDRVVPLQNEITFSRNKWRVGSLSASQQGRQVRNYRMHSYKWICILNRGRPLNKGWCVGSILKSLAGAGTVEWIVNSKKNKQEWKWWEEIINTVSSHLCSSECSVCLCSLEAFLKVDAEFSHIPPNVNTSECSQYIWPHGLHATVCRGDAAFLSLSLHFCSHKRGASAASLGEGTKPADGFAVSVSDVLKY